MHERVSLDRVVQSPPSRGRHNCSSDPSVAQPTASEPSVSDTSEENSNTLKVSANSQASRTADGNAPSIAPPTSRIPELESPKLPLSSALDNSTRNTMLTLMKPILLSTFRMRLYLRRPDALHAFKLAHGNPLTDRYCRHQRPWALTTTFTSRHATLLPTERHTAHPPLISKCLLMTATATVHQFQGDVCD